MKIFAVVGEPILHSRSPAIFNALFQALNIDACYTRLASTSAAEALKTGREMELSGMNVTSPFKEDILTLLERLDVHAKRAQAVNTVVFRKAGDIGYNTDYKGVIQALKVNGISVKGRNVVILGAGGAARAAAYGMRMIKAKKITIANRNLDRAKSLAHQFGCEFTPLHKAIEILDDGDILISCLPKPSSMLLDTSRLNDLILMDANYRNNSRFSRPNSKEKGFTPICGLDWLFFQAAQAFRIFTRIGIPVDLRNKLLLDVRSMQTPRKLHIALIGLMGSGKTTVGRKLADRLGYDFIDTDSVIEKQSGLTISEIFSRKGEFFFRGMESSILERELKHPKASVISLGGGSILDKKNLNLIRQYCHVIWLWVSVQEACDRIDSQSRPLVEISDPRKRLESLLASRKSLYARASDLVVDSGSGTVQEIAGRIKNEMDQPL